MKYCNNCKQNVEPKEDFSWLAVIGGLFIGVWLGNMLLGLLFAALARLLDKERCPICHARNWKEHMSYNEMQRMN